MTLLRTTPPAPVQEPPSAPVQSRSMLWRRIWSGVAAAAFLVLTALTAAAVYNVADTYGSIFSGGWSVLWVFALTFSYLLGVVAVALAYRPGIAGLGRRAFRIVASTMVAVFIAMWFIGPLY